MMFVNYAQWIRLLLLIMHLDRYQYIKNKSSFDYEFISKGHNGDIRKVARFTALGEQIYNFGFGDLNIVTGDIEDKVNSNNGDADKVLATVAHIIYQFAELYPKAWIFVMGSTNARTRLYQININKHWTQLEPLFEFFGYRGGMWEHFQKGINYEAIVGRKRS